MKILSFIIPAYNSEKIIDKCIASMLVPEVLDKLEIIVVNDGSTDNTAEAAERYCRRYPETVRLISQKNKGHGGALNTGCAAAQGKYLKVIDSDDWIETQNLSAFIQYLEQLESDAVLTHFNIIDIGSGEIQKWRSYPKTFGEVLSFEDIMSDWRGFYRCFTFHGITYNTKFYREYGIQLSEHVFYEDYEFATFPCCYAKSITPLDIFLYDYRIGDVNQSVSDESKLKHTDHLKTVLNRMIREYRSAAKFSPAGRDYAVVKIQELFLSYLTTVLLAEPDKKNGREQARRAMADLQKECSEAAHLAEKKYLLFVLMNHLHISNQTWKTVLNSKLYRRLRGNHDFT